MDKITDQFTFIFLVGPERRIEFFNAISSMLDLEEVPSRITLFFNPYVAKDHEAFFDMFEIRNWADIYKFSKFRSVSRCWNEGIMSAETPYVGIFNDDVIFRDPDCLKKIWDKHQEGYDIVHTTENWSGFSLHKSVIACLGWFDQNFMHSWEDIDFRYRIERYNSSELRDVILNQEYDPIKEFRFDTHLVKHLRSNRGRLPEAWNQSSDYFFRKWGISRHYPILEGKNVCCSDPQVRKQIQASGFFRKYGGVDLTPEFDTPDFYPEDLKKIRKEYA